MDQIPSNFTGKQIIPIFVILQSYPSFKLTPAFSFSKFIFLNGIYPRCVWIFHATMPFKYKTFSQAFIISCRLPVPRPGKVLGLVGTNGIGKSTALNILAGKLKPNLGKFMVRKTENIFVHFGRIHFRL
jgi:ABC-type multidrug transport system fused ATPase/permease subunit